MKHLKRFNESRMFDDMNMLLQHGEQYIINFPSKSLKWTQHLNEILREDLQYRSMGFQIDELIKEVEKESSVLETFISDISSHINELDDIFKVSQKLSEEDDKTYDELEEIKDSFEFNSEKTKEYINELQKLSKSYRNLDEQITTTKSFKFIN